MVTNNLLGNLQYTVAACMQRQFFKLGHWRRPLFDLGCLKMFTAGFTVLHLGSCHFRCLLDVLLLLQQRGSTYSHFGTTA